MSDTPEGAVPVYFRDKKIGWVLNRRFFHPKNRKHFYVLYHGLGISEEVLERVEKIADYWVVVYTTSTRKKIYYILPLPEVRIKGKSVTDTSTGIDDQQWVVPLTEFTEA